MNWLLSVVVVIQILAGLGMIGLVLVQHGKGADMGASFGSGASGSLFGATDSANFLSRTTAILAAVFFAATTYLSFVANDRARPVDEGTSVLDRPASVAPAASAPGSGATPLPGATDAAPSAAVPAAPAASGASSAPSK